MDRPILPLSLDRIHKNDNTGLCPISDAKDTMSRVLHDPKPADADREDALEVEETVDNEYEDIG
jgi:hypothetical protein